MINLKQHLLDVKQKHEMEQIIINGGTDVLFNEISKQFWMERSLNKMNIIATHVCWCGFTIGLVGFLIANLLT